MAEVREEYRYTKTHEWINLEGEVAVCGIDDYAQIQTGELVFVELPEVGEEVKSGDDVCVIESVKSASDIYTPVSGTIVEVNNALVESPILVNESCYDEGWFFKIKLDDVSEVDGLLSAEDYSKEINV